MARPKNSEKYSPQAQREKLRELCGDALSLMKKKIKKGKVDFGSLSMFVSKTLPIILDENVQNESDVTMELLIKKAVKVNLRVKEANEEGLKEEDAEENKPT